MTFSYPNTNSPTLKDINFELEQGETLGIIGKTGSGKTTLVSLLMRQHNPEEGTLFIDGRDVLRIPLNVLRKGIGYVPQDNFLFSDTIKNNILLGVQTADDRDVIDAAEKACVHDNIIDFVEGYETIIGERGVTLSGGQKQRLSIARALLIDPEILILDDSVSAVDTKTEETILKALKTERKNKTTIIIAHRISTLQNADKIILLQDGQIAETGTHDSLIDKGGIYYEMAKRQQLEAILNEEEEVQV